MNNRKHNTHLSQSDIALQIESLVQAIERNNLVKRFLWGHLYTILTSLNPVY